MLLQKGESPIFDCFHHKAGVKRFRCSLVYPSTESAERWLVLLIGLLILYSPSPRCKVLQVKVLVITLYLSLTRIGACLVSMPGTGQ